MLIDCDIERRCRYRLRLHGMRLRKERDSYGRPIYYIINETDDERPDDDDTYRWLSLDRVLKYCEELAEKDAEEKAEQKSGG